MLAAVFRSLNDSVIFDKHNSPLHVTTSQCNWTSLALSRTVPWSFSFPMLYGYIIAREHVLQTPQSFSDSSYSSCHMSMLFVNVMLCSLVSHNARRNYTALFFPIPEPIPTHTHLFDAMLTWIETDGRPPPGNYRCFGVPDLVPGRSPLFFMICIPGR